MEFRRLPNKGRIVATAVAALCATSTLAVADETTDTREVGEFNRVVLEGAADIEITVGGSPSVAVTSEAELMDRIETEVRNNTLYISQDYRRWRDWDDADLYIAIVTPSLDGVEVDGAGDIEVTGIDSNDFEVEIKGAGDITLSGKCVSASYQIDGAGDIDAEQLECEHVTITVNGAGDADIFATETVDATLNGVGDVTISGNPDSVKQRVNGFGEISQRS